MEKNREERGRRRGRWKEREWRKRGKERGRGREREEGGGLG